MTSPSPSQIAAAMPAAAAAAADARPGRRPPRQGWRLAGVFAAVAAVVFGGIAATNYRLDPLNYDGAAQAAMAAALDNGRDVAIADPNIDWRALRSRQIAQMKTTPDVILFGGSRWQEATAAAAPGLRFFNSFVTNDYFEDIVALSTALYRAHRLPKTLILSVRFFSFDYLDRHDPLWWKAFSPDYRDLSRELGIPAHSWDDSVAVGQYSHLLSAGAALDGLTRPNADAPAWQTSPTLHDPHLHVVGADGALRFSQDHLDALTAPGVERDVLQSASEDRVRRIRIDRPLLGQLGRLVTFLKSQGVRVVLVQTPFHPSYYRAIQGSPYFDDIKAVERDTRRIAAESGAVVGGGFDSAAFGCEAADYRDFNHAGDRCLQQVLRSIPGLH